MPKRRVSEDCPIRGMRGATVRSSFHMKTITNGRTEPHYLSGFAGGGGVCHMLTVALAQKEPLDDVVRLSFSDYIAPEFVDSSVDSRASVDSDTAATPLATPAKTRPVSVIRATFTTIVFCDYSSSGDSDDSLVSHFQRSTAHSFKSRSLSHLVCAARLTRRTSGASARLNSNGPGQLTVCSISNSMQFPAKTFTAVLTHCRAFPGSPCYGYVLGTPEHTVVPVSHAPLLRPLASMFLEEIRAHGPVAAMYVAEPSGAPQSPFIEFCKQNNIPELILVCAARLTRRSTRSSTRRFRSAASSPPSAPRLPSRPPSTRPGPRLSRSTTTCTSRSSHILDCLFRSTRLDSRRDGVHRSPAARAGITKQTGNGQELHCLDGGICKNTGCRAATANHRTGPRKWR